MTILISANGLVFPARTAPALATLIESRPELKRCGTGLAYSLVADRVWIVTPDADRASRAADLDREFVRTARYWVERLAGIGMSPILAISLFTDEPAPQDGHLAELTTLDMNSLHETMAIAMQGTEIDPRWLSSIIALARPAADEPIEVEAVLTSQPASEQTQRRLIAAIDSWLAPRRPYFAWIARIHVEVDTQDRWAAAGTTAIEADESEATLMWMPAAGSA